MPAGSSLHLGLGPPGDAHLVYPHYGLRSAIRGGHAFDALGPPHLSHACSWRLSEAVMAVRFAHRQLYVARHFKCA